LKNAHGLGSNDAEEQVSPVIDSAARHVLGWAIRVFKDRDFLTFEGGGV